VFRCVRLVLFIVAALLIASCASDAVSFDGERASDAADTPVSIATTAPEEAVSAPTEVPTTDTAEPADEPAPDPAEAPAAPAFDDEATEQLLQTIETPGGMVWIDNERECVRNTLAGADVADPTIDTQVLNCLNDDGVHRWVSATLGARGGSTRSIITPTESTCVWEQSGGQIFSLVTPDSPAIQQCGVWGRVNLGGLEPFSDTTLACLDLRMQTTRLPDARDRAALDERIGQCASPDELAYWQSL